MNEEKVMLVTRNEGVAWLEMVVCGILCLYVVHPEPFEQVIAKATAPIRGFIETSASWWRTKASIDDLPEVDDAERTDPVE